LSDRSPFIFIPNKGAYDYSDAERFGSLVFLSEGTLTRLNTNSLYRMFCNGMRNAQAQDYLLVSSLPVFNAIACGILVYKFGRVNYLLFSNGAYKERSVDYGALLEKEREDAEQRPVGE